MSQDRVKVTIGTEYSFEGEGDGAVLTELLAKFGAAVVKREKRIARMAARQRRLATPSEPAK